MIAAVEVNARAMEFVPREWLERDYYFCLEAVKLNPEAIKFVGMELQQKYPNFFLRAALKNDGMVLQYADITFRAKKDFVKVAALQNPLAFEFAADNVKVDKDFILDLL